MTAHEDSGMTPAEMLKEVNNAIYSICVGGQSYRIGSRQLTRGDLKTLYDMRNDLEAQSVNDSGELLGDCVVAVFDGR